MIDRELEDWKAEMAIQKVQLRYCRAIDRRDWDLLRSCFHSDAVYDCWGFRGGVEDLVHWASEGLKGFDRTSHFTGNQYVEVDGDFADAEHYLRGYHRRGATATAPATDWTVNIRYVDRMVRRDGQWRILSRLIVMDSERTDLVYDEGRVLPEYRIARNDDTDPSYSLFGTVLSGPGPYRPPS